MKKMVSYAYTKERHMVNEIKNIFGKKYCLITNKIIGLLDEVKSISSHSPLFQLEYLHIFYTFYSKLRAKSQSVFSTYLQAIFKSFELGLNEMNFRIVFRQIHPQDRSAMGCRERLIMYKFKQLCSKKLMVESSIEFAHTLIKDRTILSNQRQFFKNDETMTPMNFDICYFHIELILKNHRILKTSKRKKFQYYSPLYRSFENANII